MLVYIASLILIAAIVAAFLVASDRRDRRERAERAELLQRIQAPHAAVAEHHHAVDPPVDPGSGLPMTDAEVAELQGNRVDVPEELRKWIAQVEAIENGTAQLEDGVLQ
jgi:HD superfamily phosphodiesterase